MTRIASLEKKIAEEQRMLRSYRRLMMTCEVEPGHQIEFVVFEGTLVTIKAWRWGTSWRWSLGAAVLEGEGVWQRLLEAAMRPGNEIIAVRLCSKEKEVKFDDLQR